MDAMLRWFYEQWWAVQHMGFLGQVGIAIGCLVAVLYLLAEPGQVIGWLLFCLCALFGHVNWGIWGTAGGVVVGAVAGFIAFMIVEAIREDMRAPSAPPPSAGDTPGLSG